MGIPYQTDFDFVYYITQEIFEEIHHIKKNIDGFGLLVTLKRVIIREPSLENSNKVSEISMKTGQHGLSMADKSIIALSLDMKLPLLSSDYALVNMAKQFSIHVIVPGKKKFYVNESKKYCSICKRFLGLEPEYCNECGNKLVYKTRTLKKY